MILNFFFSSGCLLSLFLGPDAGPRDGAIRLSPEKVDEHPTIPEEASLPPSPLQSPKQGFYGNLRRKVSSRLSGYFANRVHDAYAPDASPPPAVPLSTSVPGRRFSRMSRANGSAYGYGGGTARVRSRLASGATMRRASASSSVRRRGSAAPDGLPRSFGDAGELNFAQRLLMANENAVTNIADLWVASAMNVDNEEVFESDTELESAGDDEGAVFDMEDEEDEDEVEDILDTPTRRGRLSKPSILFAHRPSFAGRRLSQAPRTFGSPRRPSASTSYRPQSSTNPRMPSFGQGPHERRFSTVPSIFAHPGVKSPSAVLDAQRLLSQPDDVDRDALNSMLERRGAAVPAEGDLVEEPSPPLFSQLPILIITQYGLLALHSTTHDMVFLSYLVS